MIDEMGRNVRVDIRFDSYHNIFNDDWGERIVALVKSSPKLSALVFDLLIEWRAAAYTAALPVTILEHMKAFHDGFVNTAEINTTLLRLADAVIPKLAEIVPNLTADPVMVRDLRSAIVDTGAKIEAARDKAEFEFPLEETWRDYLTDHVYQLSLWGSQRICYVSIYNSYDNFLARAVRIAASLPSCRTSDRDFNKNLTTSFGEPNFKKCWTDSKLNIARLVRHSLSHAGGRITNDLEKLEHGFAMLDDRIQVMPDNTKALYKLLEECVYSLAETAVTMPEFN